MAKYLKRAAECCIPIAGGIFILGVGVAALSFGVPDEWIDMPHAPLRGHAALAYVIFCAGIVFSLCFVALSGIIRLIVDIMNKFDPEFQAAQLAAKAQRDRDDRIREKALEIITERTGLPASIYCALMKQEFIPQEIIDLAIDRLENNCS